MSGTIRTKYQASLIVFDDSTDDLKILLFSKRKKLQLPQISVSINNDNYKETNKKCIEALIKFAYSKMGLILLEEYCHLVETNEATNSVIYYYRGNVKKVGEKENVLVSIDQLDFSKVASQFRNVIIKFITKKVELTKNENAVFTELNYLRAEILNRFSTREKMIHFNLFLAGVCISFSKHVPEALIFFPLLGTAFAALWSHSDIRIYDIGNYVRTQIESFIPGLNWEDYIFQYYKKKPQKGKRQEFYVLWVFWGSYILTFLFLIISNLPSLDFINVEGWYWLIYLSEVSNFIYLFLFSSIILVLSGYFSWKFITERRKKYNNSPFCK